MRNSNSILQHSPLALAITEGPTHVIREANPAFCALLGKPALEIVGQTVSSNVSGAGAADVVALLDRVYSGDKHGSVDNLHCTDPDDSLKYMLYVAWSMPVQDGYPADLVINATDVTDKTYASRRQEQQTNEITDLNNEVRLMNEQLVISGLRLQAAVDRHRAVAEALQNSILWDETERTYGRLRASVIYEAAREEALVGGDLFDVITLPNGSILLSVGDVTGKGLKAVARIAEVIFAVRAFAQDYRGPADMLSRLNDLVCNFHKRDNDIDKSLIALSLIAVDPLTGMAQAASAGAEPPLVLRASGLAEEMNVRGLVLGVQPSMEYETHDFLLHAGDILMMTTDGLTETRREQDFFGYDHLIAAARVPAATGSLHDIGTAVVEAARVYGGGHFVDDVCLLLARLDQIAQVSRTAVDQ